LSLLQRLRDWTYGFDLRHGAAGGARAGGGGELRLRPWTPVGAARPVSGEYGLLRAKGPTTVFGLALMGLAAANRVAVFGF